MPKSNFWHFSLQIFNLQDVLKNALKESQMFVVFITASTRLRIWSVSFAEFVAYYSTGLTEQSRVCLKRVKVSSGSFSPSSDDMSFTERLSNLVNSRLSQMFQESIVVREQRIYRMLYGKTFVSLNVSVLSNSPNSTSDCLRVQFSLSR